MLAICPSSRPTGIHRQSMGAIAEPSSSREECSKRITRGRGATGRARRFKSEVAGSNPVPSAERKEHEG